MKAIRKSISYRFLLFMVFILCFVVIGGCEKRKDKGNAKEDGSIEKTNEEGENESNSDAIYNSSEETIISSAVEETISQEVVNYPYERPLNILDDNYRTYYEVFLYSYCDSNGDGIGEINGLISKLDYINDGDDTTDRDLGFNGIWLMPIMPSSSYHKYDVEDYYGIDNSYGTIEDFKRLIKECDKRGIKLIIDLVINHSSRNHPWFLSAVQSLGIPSCGQKTCTQKQGCIEHNPYVKYYNFSKGKPEKGTFYSTGVEDWYYEGAFSSDMPDLNLDDSNLRKELEDIMKYWLNLGVGGFRLDAAMHFFDQDTDKNIEVLTFINDYVKSIKQDSYIVAEIWTNFSKYVRYYESGIDSVFNFAFATETGIIAKTLNNVNSTTSGKTFTEAMLQVQDGINKYTSTGMDAPFFTNHDTARGAGYFMDDIRMIKMATGLNLMMGGSTFVYYGEELGMSGTGRDENKRAPMYWSDENKKSMTKGPTGMEVITHKYGSYEEQKDDMDSIYNYVKRGVRLRNENPEIARGRIEEIIYFGDNQVSMIKKVYKGEEIYILYNISGEEKEISLSEKIENHVQLRGYLSGDNTEITYENEIIKISPYSITILK